MSSSGQDGTGFHGAPPYPAPYTAGMCDTLCAPGRRGMVFAKNSDRPPGEVQIAWPFGRRASAGCTLRTQYLSIGDSGAHATFLSCPTWLWGAEHGVNEHGVAIGNERVGTIHDAAVGQAGPDRHGPGPPRARTRPHRGRGGRRHRRPARDVRAGWHRRRRPPGGLRLLVPDRRPLHGVRARDGGLGLRRWRPFPPAWPSPTGSCSAPSGRGPPPAWRWGEDFDRFRDPGVDTAFADVRLAASRRFLASTSSGGLTPAATAAHLRDHGTGPWGAPGLDGPVHAPPARVGADRSGVSVCMHVRGHSVTAASMIAELPPGLAEGAPLRVYVAAGSPCASIYVPAFPAHGRRPPAVRPLRALRRGAVARRRRPAPAGRGRPRPRSPGLRETLKPVEDELWAEADDVSEDPARWADVGAIVGCSGAPCAAVLYPLTRAGAAVRCGRTRVCTPTRQGGCHDRRTH